MFDVQIQHITKTYEKGKVRALNDISFDINQGELFGLIGPDGAGKTTLFRILTTLLLPDSGNAYVNGFHIENDFWEIRKKVGYMPGKFSLYQDLTVEENLNFFATLFNTSIQENYDLIKEIYVQIEPFKDRRAGKLSGGMKQKLALSCALIHRPSVLFLDEPTTGVDAVSRKEFWEMLQRLKEQGITILVSTPYMDEAALCERVALIQSGEILTIDTPQGIIDTYPKPMYACRASGMSRLLNVLRQHTRIESAYSFGDWHHVTINYEQEQVNVKHDLNKEFPDLEWKSIQPGIEDCFIHLSSRIKGESV
jgi:ABC-type multidrug transport system ATPase subunit